MEVATVLCHREGIQEEAELRQEAQRPLLATKAKTSLIRALHQCQGPGTNGMSEVLQWGRERRRMHLALRRREW